MMNMDLRKKLIELTSFSILDILVVKLGFALSFLLVARFLPREDVGIIGLVAGYIVIFKLLAVQPEGILYRDFPRMKDKFNEHLSAFTAFWFFRLTAIQTTGGIVSYIVYLFYRNPALSLYLFGATLILNLELLQEMIKETYRVSFRQKTVFVVNTAFIILQLVGVALLFLYPSLLLYLTILLLVNISNSLAWYLLLKTRYGFTFRYRGAETLSLLKKNLKEFSLWAHFNNSVWYLIYQIDTFILGFFAPLEVIGDYTIALLIANFFFIIPAMFHKSFAIGFSHLSDEKTIRNSLRTFLKYSFLISIVQLALYLLLGRIITSIFTSVRIDTIFTYSLIILIGVTIFNIFRPLNSFILVKADLRRAFFDVFFPTALFSIITYFMLTFLFNAMGTAYGNIVSYSFFSLLTILFLRRSLPTRPNAE